MTRKIRQLLPRLARYARAWWDTHLAALAVQHGCTLMSTDGDFAGFPKLKWSNPLK